MANDDVATEVCPQCGATTLIPVDELFDEIERRVVDGTERWACPCGYAEDRPTGLV